MSVYHECWALVTGASRGIGYLASRSLASMGCNLILGARGLEGLRQAAESLQDEYGVEVVPVPLDMRSQASVDSFISSALEAAAYNIGVAALSTGNPMCEPCSLDEASWWDWIEATQLYVASIHQIMRRLAHESATRPVRVIVFSSWTIREPQPMLSVADVVRAGLPNMIRLAAREWPGRLVPILVLLGSFDTPGARRTVEEIAKRIGRDPETFWKEQVEALSPLGRAGRPEELMELVAFLARAPEYMAGTIVEFHAASTKCT